MSLKPNFLLTLLLVIVTTSFVSVFVYFQFPLFILIFYLFPVLIFVDYLKKSIVLDDVGIVYKSLTSEESTRYSDISYVRMEISVSRSRDSDGNSSNSVSRYINLLREDNTLLVRIPFSSFGGKRNREEFMNYLYGHNNEIEFDYYCERLLIK